ncbi:MAG TPA: hypothetical protein VI306_10385 [Pyrinomonadaceae bacterium]
MDLSPETFELLLNWLHPDREAAGEVYQRIRALLVKTFQNHGCSIPDKLADLTIDRVAQRLNAEFIENWNGEKAKYFSRVGYYILLENRKKNLHETQMSEKFDATNPEKEDELERRLNCLEECLGKLSAAKRELIMGYYYGKRAIKIKNREQLAEDLNLNVAGLRVRALRIRKELKMCIEQCLEGVAK